MHLIESNKLGLPVLIVGQSTMVFLHLTSIGIVQERVFPRNGLVVDVECAYCLVPGVA